jgi:hypothetical protein
MNRWFLMANLPDLPQTSSRRLDGLLRWLARTVTGLVLLVLLNACLRPWYMGWGATASELQRIYPGDQLAPDVLSVATRAITIKAPAVEVWPWIVQTGEDRAGFYSYTWLENLFLADMHNAERINPQWQSRQVGDTVWLANKNRYHGTARTVVAIYEPGHAMVLVSPPDYEKLVHSRPPISGAWTFILEPEGDHASRLIMRSRGRSTGILKRASDYFIFDPAHFIMERGMLLGIKRRAEQAADAPPESH